MAISEALARFYGFYRAVAEGECYTMTYRPGKGTTLVLNGERLGTVLGAEFAAVYFGIWLDRGALSKTLRRGLVARFPAG